MARVCRLPVSNEPLDANSRNLEMSAEPPETSVRSEVSQRGARREPS